MSLYGCRSAGSVVKSIVRALSLRLDSKEDSVDSDNVVMLSLLARAAPQPAPAGASP